MASPRKKKTPKIKFELSKSGILGIVVIIFCVFLWMFLLGLWAGRNVLPQTQEKTLSIGNVQPTSKTKPKGKIPRLNNGTKKKIIISQ
ncbi:MAG: hypothetical protein OCC45_00115 [Desulfotalea sp.]